jgi:hypothetical protein
MPRPNNVKPASKTATTSVGHRSDDPAKIVVTIDKELVGQYRTIVRGYC